MNAMALPIHWQLGSPLGSREGLPGPLSRWLFRMEARRRGSEATPVRLVPATVVSAAEDDRRDVEASLAGDSDAYERLVRRHQQQIAAYMWRFTRDRLHWEELVHEVFVEAYFSLGTYRAQAPLAHWLRRIATRVGYRWWKQVQRRRRQTALAPEEWQQVVQSDPQHSDAKEAAATIHTLLAEMSPRDRLVLTLIYLEECTIAETARLTGWSQTMVKVQAHRARKRLKRLLEDICKRERPH